MVVVGLGEVRVLMPAALVAQWDEECGVQEDSHALLLRANECVIRSPYATAILNLGSRIFRKVNHAAL